MSHSRPLLRPDENPRLELGLQLGSRLMALLKSGLAYPIEHPTFRQQLENYLLLLRPVLDSEGVARFEAPDGDLCMNGSRLPYRPHMVRSLEQLAYEFGSRAIVGVEFRSGLTLHELTTFMVYFLPGERWKGSDLLAACDNAGLVRARPLPLDPGTAARSTEVAAHSLPATIGPALAGWTAWLDCARTLLRGDALDQGVELRYVKRVVQPLVDGVLADNRVATALAHVSPGESDWEHAAHTSLAALCVGARLGLSRHDLAEVAVAALLHDVGHAWSQVTTPKAAPAAVPEGAIAAPALAPAQGGEPAPHTREGIRRLAWATTLNRTSLDAMRAALEHHTSLVPDAGVAHRPPALLSQVVGIADAYVTLLSAENTMAPTSALARLLGPLRASWHPAIPVALVHALGLYPPGQVVEFDDGSLARAVVPNPNDPEKPWIEMVTDFTGAVIATEHREAVPWPAERRVTRALPRAEWPGSGPLPPGA